MKGVILTLELECQGTESASELVLALCELARRAFNAGPKVLQDEVGRKASEKFALALATAGASVISTGTRRAK